MKGRLKTTVYVRMADLSETGRFLPHSICSFFSGFQPLPGLHHARSGSNNGMRLAANDPAMHTFTPPTPLPTA
ncbi:hypothetical protein NEIMUCOT_03903 [Neisseria mucosa ATCC 25996]|uniref:Uncharacterized protein n=1 Tax=Neisseria mucosa (strain ATCC 25996 / DSM 4631 / NCTC 10774 / M26) TaxID=546266 RepID=D2ZTG7_NEIM2|nr:hypothetical protein NEIMUCOT_03903 [Neisseria mucosa ATCC 25996]